jgi:hypothetical protein
LVLLIAGCGAADGDGSAGNCRDEFMGARATEVDALSLSVTDQCDENHIVTGDHTIGACGNVHYFQLWAKNPIFTDDVGKNLCLVDPTVKTDAKDLRICMFFSCREGATSIGCPDGTEAATSPIGLPGCCGGSPGTLKADLKCDYGNGIPISDDSASVYLRVERAAGPAPTSELESDCINYNLDFHF